MISPRDGARRSPGIMTPVVADGHRPQRRDPRATTSRARRAPRRSSTRPPAATRARPACSRSSGFVPAERSAAGDAGHARRAQEREVGQRGGRARSSPRSAARSLRYLDVPPTRRRAAVQIVRRRPAGDAERGSRRPRSAAGDGRRAAERRARDAAMLARAERCARRWRSLAPLDVDSRWRAAASSWRRRRAPGAPLARARCAASQLAPPASAAAR